MDNTITLDSYVIIQKDNFMKIHKLTSKSLRCQLGDFTIDIGPIVNEPFWSTYKMIPDGRKHFKLSKVECVETFSDDLLQSTESGADNRNITDDGSSQKLSTEEIIGLSDKGMSAVDIVGTLIENSKTFASKTEYSQEKYLKKKERKYARHIIVRKPNFRLVSEIILTRGSARLLGLRMDNLAQITTLSCIRPGGCYIIYESGCQGLILAAVLNAIGSNGTIIHVHSGNVFDRHALNSLNLPPARLNQILSIHVQNLSDFTTLNNVDPFEALDLEPECKKRKVDENNENDQKKARWEEREEHARAMLKKTLVDGLVVVGKEHPSNIVKRLLRFLKPSRPFVAFSAIREPLQELFVDLKMRSDVISLRLTESWLRFYQVLPDRTHPDINMSGSGGFLLSGITVAE